MELIIVMQILVLVASSLFFLLRMEMTEVEKGSMIIAVRCDIG